MQISLESTETSGFGLTPKNNKLEIPLERCDSKFAPPKSPIKPPISAVAKRRNDAYNFFKSYLEKKKSLPKKIDIVNDYPLAYKFNNNSNEVFLKTFNKFLEGSTNVQDVMDARNFPRSYRKVKVKREERKKMMNFKDLSEILMEQKKTGTDTPQSPLKSRTHSRSGSPFKRTQIRSSTLMLLNVEQEKKKENSNYFSIIKNKIHERVKKKKDIINELEKKTDKYQYSFNDPKFMMHFYAYQNELLEGMKKKYSDNYVDKSINNECMQKNKLLKSFQLRKEHNDFDGNSEQQKRHNLIELKMGTNNSKPLISLYFNNLANMLVESLNIDESPRSHAKVKIGETSLIANKFSSFETGTTRSVSSHTSRVNKSLRLKRVENDLSHEITGRHKNDVESSKETIKTAVLRRDRKEKGNTMEKPKAYLDLSKEKNLKMADTNDTSIRSKKENLNKSRALKTEASEGPANPRLNSPKKNEIPRISFHINKTDSDIDKDDCNRSFMKKEALHKKQSIYDDRKHWNHNRRIFKFFNKDIEKKHIEKIFPTAYTNEYSRQLADMENFDDKIMVQKLEEIERNKNDPNYLKKSFEFMKREEKERNSKRSNFLNRTANNKMRDTDSFFVIKRNTSNSELNDDLNILNTSGDDSAISYTEEKLSRLYNEARDIQSRIYDKKRDHLSKRMKQLIKLKTITESISKINSQKLNN